MGLVQEESIRGTGTPGLAEGKWRIGEAKVPGQGRCWEGTGFNSHTRHTASRPQGALRAGQDFGCSAHVSTQLPVPQSFCSTDTAGSSSWISSSHPLILTSYKEPDTQGPGMSGSLGSVARRPRSPCLQRMLIPNPRSPLASASQHQVLVLMSTLFLRFLPVYTTSLFIKWC